MPLNSFSLTIADFNRLEILVLLNAAIQLAANYKSGEGCANNVDPQNFSQILSKKLVRSQVVKCCI